MERSEKIEIVNDIMIKIHEEDHTIMNPLRWCIARNFAGKHVELVGYTIPHPSEHSCDLKIQFTDKNMQTPQNVLSKTMEGLDCTQVILERILSSITRCHDQPLSPLNHVHY